MTTSVSICSNALLLLGDAPISDFSEDNDRTRLVSNIYNYKRDKVLRAHNWSCAKKLVILSPLVAPPPFKWSYQFQLPADWLRVIGVGVPGDQDDFDIIRNTIVMDSNVCRLEYIFRNEVEQTWDALLVDAMTQVMIAALTYPITKSTTKQATEEEIVERVLKKARSVGGIERPSETLGDSPLLSNRMG